MAVDIVADLFALIAEDGVGPASDYTFYQVAEKAVQFGGGMRGAGQAAAAEGGGFESEVTAVFLDQDIASDHHRDADIRDTAAIDALFSEFGKNIALVIHTAARLVTILINICYCYINRWLLYTGAWDC